MAAWQGLLEELVRDRRSALIGYAALLTGVMSAHGSPVADGDVPLDHHHRTVTSACGRRRRGREPRPRERRDGILRGSTRAGKPACPRRPQRRRDAVIA